MLYPPFSQTYYVSLPIPTRVGRKTRRDPETLHPLSTGRPTSINPPPLGHDLESNRVEDRNPVTNRGSPTSVLTSCYFPSPPPSLVELRVRDRTSLPLEPFEARILLKPPEPKFLSLNLSSLISPPVFPPGSTSLVCLLRRRPRARTHHHVSAAHRTLTFLSFDTLSSPP